MFLDVCRYRPIWDGSCWLTVARSEITVDSVWPVYGPVNGGTRVTITGQFLSTSSVTLVHVGRHPLQPHANGSFKAFNLSHQVLSFQYLMAGLSNRLRFGVADSNIMALPCGRKVTYSWYDVGCCIYHTLHRMTFNALTLLAWQQEGHLAYKKWVVGCWHGYLSEMRCRFAYGPADATATQCILLQQNVDWFYLSCNGSSK